MNKSPNAVTAEARNCIRRLSFSSGANFRRRGMKNVILLLLPEVTIVPVPYTARLSLLQQHQRCLSSNVRATPHPNKVVCQSAASAQYNNDNDITMKATKIASSSEESILKDPSSTTATASTTKTFAIDKKVTESSQKPRPIFPWRHDIVPIPRLISGTMEYEDAKTELYVFSFQYRLWRRLAAHWYLNVPIFTAMFSFNRWNQSLADDAAYAFTKGVAGIVSNTYQIPIKDVSTEVNDSDLFSFLDGDKNNDDDDDDDIIQMVHFKYPPDANQEDDSSALHEELNDEVMAILNQVLNIDPDDKDDRDHETKKRTINTPSSDKLDSVTIDLTAENDKEEQMLKNGLRSDDTENTPIETTATAVSETETSQLSVHPNNNDEINTDATTLNNGMNIAPTKDAQVSTTIATDDSNPTIENSVVPPLTATTSSLSEKTHLDESLNKEVESRIQRHPAFLKPYVPKSYAKDTTTLSSNDDGQDEFCSRINSMMIEPLRKLYQSAHESGRDQLTIKLHMRPIEAQFISLFAVPYVTREGGAEIMKVLHDKHREGGPAAVRAAIASMPRILEKKTTVELQVLISCVESFQVTDRETGVVLQGSEDGMPQEVTHTVRLETTADFIDNKWIRSDDWQITDIDDMLGHKAWYVL